MSHQLVDLGWVEFLLGVPLSGPAAQPHLPNFHLPKWKWADSGKAKVNPTQVCEQMGHTASVVDRLQNSLLTRHGVVRVLTECECGPDNNRCSTEHIIVCPEIALHDYNLVISQSSSRILASYSRISLLTKPYNYICKTRKV